MRLPRRTSVLAVLIPFVVLLALPAAALALAPPAPAAPTVTRIDRPDRIDLEVSWLAVVDPEGEAVTYRVVARAQNGNQRSAVTSDARARLIDVLPGSSIDVHVTAVDASGGASAPSAPTTVSTPRLASHVAASLLSNRLPVSISRCGTAAVPCDVETPDGWVLRVATAPLPRAGEAWVERRVRTAQQSTSRGLPSLQVEVGVGMTAALLPLAGSSPRVAAGRYCLRAVIRGTQQLIGSSSAWRCLHVRPRVTIGWAGDTTLGSHAYGNPPSGGRHVFDGVLRLLRAPDLMVGNYEGTLSTGGTPRCSGGSGCYIFQAPPGNARALDLAGFDVMNLANNHALDMGRAARDQTVRSLNAYGIRHTGLPGEITYVQVRETRVALVGFAHSAGTMHLRDRDFARTMVRRAAAHADVVVVAMHAGAEGSGASHVPNGDEYAFGENRGNTRAFTHAVVDAGADLVVGSGPHVVRGVERRNGRLIFYSTGNFAGFHNFNLGGGGSQSGIVNATLAFNGAIKAARWYPVRLEGPGLPVRGGTSIIRRVSSLTRSDFPRTGARITTLGYVS